MIKYVIDKKSIDKRAKIVWMEPRQFLHDVPFTWGLINTEILNNFKNKLINKVPLDVPFIDKDCNGKIIEHEGRHRVLASLCLGIKKIPVQIFDKCKKGEA